MATDDAEEKLPDGDSKDKEEEDEGEDKDKEEEDEGEDKDKDEEEVEEGEDKDKGNNKDDAEEKLPDGDSKDNGNNKDDAKEELPDGDSKDKGNNKDDAQKELPDGDSTEATAKVVIPEKPAILPPEAAEIGGAPDGFVLDFDEELMGGDAAMSPLAEPQICAPSREVTTGGRKEKTSGAGADEPVM
jgi:hypothetical protein